MIKFLTKATIITGLLLQPVILCTLDLDFGDIYD
jgi:hypothetical protein